MSVLVTELLCLGTDTTIGNLVCEWLPFTHVTDVFRCVEIISFYEHSLLLRHTVRKSTIEDIETNSPLTSSARTCPTAVLQVNS